MYKIILLICHSLKANLKFIKPLHICVNMRLGLRSRSPLVYHKVQSSIVGRIDLFHRISNDEKKIISVILCLEYCFACVTSIPAQFHFSLSTFKHMNDPRRKMHVKRWNKSADTFVNCECKFVSIETVEAVELPPSLLKRKPLSQSKSHQHTYFYRFYTYDFDVDTLLPLGGATII